MSQLLVAQRALTVPGWAKDALWRRAQAIPSLDLRFADSKSLVDATTGSNLVTFTRASSGTFVGSDGVLQTAVTNLLLRSEEFDNASWTKSGGSISANSVASPSGATTADTFAESAVTEAHFLTGISSSAAASTTYTFSFFAKSNGRNLVGAWVRGLSSSDRVDVQFNLSTGAVVSGPTSRGTFTGAAASIQSLPGGWFRCTLTGTSGASETSIRVLISTDTSVGTIAGSYTGDGTSGIYIWGAQLEQSSSVGEYIPTTSTINSAPRFDHNPTTGESLGLLVEESRTNLALQSEDFSTTWAALRSTVATNATTAPNGAATADKLVEDSTASNTHVISQTFSFVSGTAYNWSIYAKAEERTQIRMQAGNQVTFPADVRFDLSNGTIASNIAGTGRIESAGNGWYRCSITATAGATAVTGLFHYLVSGSVISYTGDGTSGIFLWGAQLEAGAFPTSYTPTLAASVTRSADVCSISGSNFSGWYRQDEGTFMAEYLRNPLIGAVQGRVAVFTDGTINNRIYDMRQDNASSMVVITSVAGVLEATASVALNAATGFNKVAAAQSLNNFAASANGAAPATDASVANSTVNRLEIGAFLTLSSTGYINGTIRRLVYWGQRLPNSTLQAVTQ